MATVNFVTHDCQHHTAERKAIVRSSHIRELLEDAEDVSKGKPLPAQLTLALSLPEVDGEAFRMVIAYCTHHKDEALPVEDSLPPRDEFDSWDTGFIRVSNERLLTLMKVRVNGPN